MNAHVLMTLYWHVLHDFQSTSFSLPSLLIWTEDCTDAIPTVNLFLCRNVYDLGSQMYSNCSMLQPICNILSCSHVYLANRNFFFPLEEVWEGSQTCNIRPKSKETYRLGTRYSWSLQVNRNFKRSVFHTYHIILYLLLNFNFSFYVRNRRMKRI